jgi:uncharacterized protein involved in type VI secretion and phage assembly
MTGLFLQFKKLLLTRGLEYFGRYYSSYRGSCYANDDPEGLGRIRVSCPQVYGDVSPDKWAWPRGLPAGRGHGFFWVPQPGDPVFVTFEGGDPDFPLFEHGWWVRDAVPATARKANPTTYLLQTPQGHRLEFDDATGTLLLHHRDGHYIKLRPEGIEMAGNGTRTVGKILKDLFQEEATLIVDTPLGPSGPPRRTLNIKALKDELAAFFL